MNKQIHRQPRLQFLTIPCTLVFESGALSLSGYPLVLSAGLNVSPRALLVSSLATQELQM